MTRPRLAQWHQSGATLGQRPEWTADGWQPTDDTGGASLSGWIDAVNDYGVVADGSTDDGPALNAAIAAANASGTGPRRINLPCGVMKITTPLTALGVATLIGATRGFGTGTTPASTLQRDHDGDFITLDSAGTIQDVTLYDPSSGAARTGAAVKVVAVTSGGSLVRRASFLKIRDLYITCADAAGGWERCIEVAGDTSVAIGTGSVRDIIFDGVWCFGASTPGETIRVEYGVHIQFVGGGMFPAPTSPTIAQGVKLVNTQTQQIMFANFDMEGGFWSEAQDVVYVGAMYEEPSGVGITLTSGAVRNYIVGPLAMTGAVTNSSATSVINFTTTPYTDEMARDAIAAALVEGTGIDITVNDGADTITIASTVTATAGELLMQDGVTAPPVPLENEARDDWLYEG